MTEPAEGQVSVIIPARNEEANIERVVRSVAAQSPLLEILVVDDQSEDGTAAALSRLQSEFPQLHVLHTAELPGGWTGKSHAVALAARQARGEWLLLTDADTEHLPGSLETLVHRAAQEGAALLSVSPGQETPSLWEKAVIPLVYVRLARLFRFSDVSDPRSPAAAANGQYILVRRGIYEAVGGHAAVRGEILEDVALAQRVKRAGGKLIFLPGAAWVRTRMYRSFAEMWHGWTKNLFLLYGRSLARVLNAVAELWLLDVVPVAAFLVFCAVLALGRGGVAAVVGAMGCFLIAVLRQWSYGRALGAIGFDRSLGNLLVPGAVLLGLLMLNSAFAHRPGGRVVWKGRNYTSRGDG